jgi:hypothetical protein
VGGHENSCPSPIHLSGSGFGRAGRFERNARDRYGVSHGRGRKGGETPNRLVTISAKRIGTEKRGDEFALLVSLNGEPMHRFGSPIKLHLDEPLYVGIGFCSHLPETVDTAVLSNVVLENSAGKVR